jgi:hypothetical protein
VSDTKPRSTGTCSERDKDEMNDLAKVTRLDVLSQQYQPHPRGLPREKMKILRRQGPRKEGGWARRGITTCWYPAGPSQDSWADSGRSLGCGTMTDTPHSLRLQPGSQDGGAAESRKAWKEGCRQGCLARLIHERVRIRSLTLCSRPES